MKATDSKLFIDSSGWLAYFLAENQEIKSIIEQEAILLTSVISLFEIKKKLLKEKYEPNKINKVLELIKTRSIIIQITPDIAEESATISVEEELHAIDAIIYISAQKNKAMLITGDNDFRKLSDVKVIR